MVWYSFPYRSLSFSQHRETERWVDCRHRLKQFVDSRLSRRCPGVQKNFRWRVSPDRTYDKPFEVLVIARCRERDYQLHAIRHWVLWTFTYQAPRLRMRSPRLIISAPLSRRACEKVSETFFHTFFSRVKRHHGNSWISANSQILGIFYQWSPWCGSSATPPEPLNPPQPNTQLSKIASEVVSNLTPF